MSKSRILTAINRLATVENYTVFENPNYNPTFMHALNELALANCNRAVSGLISQSSWAASFSNEAWQVLITDRHKPAHVEQLVFAFTALQKAEALTPENIKAAALHDYPVTVSSAITKALKMFKNTPFFNDAAHQKRILDSNGEAQQLAQALDRTNQGVDLHSPENWSAIFRLGDQNGGDLHILWPLEQTFTAFSQYTPETGGGRTDKQSNFLTQENFDWVIEHYQSQAILHFSRIMLLLGHHTLLNQRNFDLIKRHFDPMLTDKDFSELLNQIPIQLERPLQQTHFDAIIAIIASDAERSEKLLRLPDYIHRDIIHTLHALGAAGDNTAQFNPAQSTHTASVHASISETALALKKLYGENIVKKRRADDELPGYKEMAAWLQQSLQHVSEAKQQLSNLSEDTATVDDIQAILSPLRWITSLEATTLDSANEVFESFTLKIEAAQQQLTSIDNKESIGTFVDPRSQISTRQFLAIAWRAIHDDTVRPNHSKTM